MRKKILYVITKSAWGGAQRYVYDLATHLPREQFDVAVACGGQGPLTEQLRSAGIRTVTVPHLARDIHLGQELRALWALLKIFKHERPDIIHFSSSKAGGLGAIAALVSKLLTFNFKPVRRTPGRLLTVFTVHGWPFGEERPGWQRLLIFFPSWLTTLLQQKIILIDTADYKTARRFVPQRKLTLIFHGIGAIDFLPRSTARAFFATESRSTTEPDTIFIGVNAEFTKNKGQRYLIEATALLKFRTKNSKFKILMIGDGEDREVLQRRIQALGLADTVFLLGFVPGAARYLTGLDIFVLPSVKEGLPYAILEAMAAGLPIVATRIGGIPDLIADDASGILVPAKNPGALERALEMLLDDQERGRTLGAAAQKALRVRFSLQNMIERTVMIYRSA